MGLQQSAKYAGCVCSTQKNVLTTASGIHCADARHKTELLQQREEQEERKGEVQSVITAGRQAGTAALSH